MISFLRVLFAFSKEKIILLRMMLNHIILNYSNSMFCFILWTYFDGLFIFGVKIFLNMLDCSLQVNRIKKNNISIFLTISLQIQNFQTILSFVYVKKFQSKFTCMLKILGFNQNFMFPRFIINISIFRWQSFYYL